MAGRFGHHRRRAASDANTDNKQTLFDVNVYGTFPLLGFDHDFMISASSSYNHGKQKSWHVVDEVTANWNDWDGQFAKPEFAADGSEDTTADSTQKLKSLYVLMNPFFLLQE